MRLKVLGCSGGIGGPEARTTAFLADDDVLIDCGTGVGDLALEELAAIDHIFVTHSHMDHIAAIPLIVDAVGEMRGVPITVYAIPEVLRILRAHIFNWLIWPDFTAIPDRRRPFLRLQPIKIGEEVRLGDRTITPLPALHSVPAVAYCLDGGKGQLVYSGDTTYSPELVSAINACPDLRHLIIESAFPDEQHGLALASRHLSPAMVAAFLDEIAGTPQVHISHIKPGQGERVMAQLAAAGARLHASALRQGQVIEF
ncbi:3',5'-cyclic-nucleotide phosphodiesterase [Aromatoleum petrolei]|uniref:MBL fold metallo-hydrolase n=1 Tax=Aromatoleum petrolei TaxID=76116 RepID=A0ABX1MHM6_9RHOO|nr:3',5'-cyclic-nucleotide phosphodiesterase [Aromatoleum petrolei]NMF87443.1 MBL fold metallo-hydrolase [Aromatoleum petrolei]QTQ35810.1 3'5'-cyclic-nucleotide phosphodiesterase [Aromatoleum petrolei]